MNTKDYFEPFDFDGTHSERIQAAVDKAISTGKNTVVIPRITPEGGQIWTADKTILLPSNITLILDNCHIRMADGVMCPMFKNSLANTAEGTKKENVQENINIIGKGNVVLDGGNNNGLNEQTSEKDGMPSVWENLTIYLHNVQNFSVKGIKFKDWRWWAMAFMYARFGRIEDISFELSEDYKTMFEEISKGKWRNQDGIDLRVGCHDIAIKNIYGQTGDDVIALTALNGKREIAEKVEGLSSDIHDVSVKSVFATCVYCAIVRILNHFGNKIYNIVIDDIHEIGECENSPRAQMGIRMGDVVYALSKGKDALIKHGELFNISISNIFLRSMIGVQFDSTVKNLHVNNMYLLNEAQHAVTCGWRIITDGITDFEYDSNPNYTAHYTEAENVLVENVYYMPEESSRKAPESLFAFQNLIAKNVKVRNVVNETDTELIKEYCDMPKIGEDIVFE